MIPCRSLALCALLAAAVPVFPRELRCAERQYLFQERCCSDCAPGQQIQSRCTALSDTVCVPCQDGYFTWNRKGSVEVKRCERSSDRVCACRAGFSPSGSPVGSECSRCPEGTFSRGGNELCQPWTNCSRRGQRTLRAGSGTEDSVCGDPDEERSCRVPIQEEQMDPNSSLIKN
ncbi:tumor necrosis factor receptor superfamily member 4-like [Malurus melanocephalus]|uniref:tumor necrosis factor receptor superfamily member 4-like n=1 Tax=Malurus melanocephalus TaxID=175006 RepID=UPI0025482B6C|nr:tumor necrosis factor receptor superfamily member 4-like [Malurus melanocephalus]